MSLFIYRFNLLTFLKFYQKRKFRLAVAEQKFYMLSKQYLDELEGLYLAKQWG